MVWFGYVWEHCFFTAFKSLIILSGGWEDLLKCGHAHTQTHMLSQTSPHLIAFSFFLGKIYGLRDPPDRLLPWALRTHHSSKEANVSCFLWPWLNVVSIPRPCTSSRSSVYYHRMLCYSDSLHSLYKATGFWRPIHFCQSSMGNETFLLSEVEQKYVALAWYV